MGAADDLQNQPITTKVVQVFNEVRGLAEHLANAGGEVVEAIQEFMKDAAQGIQGHMDDIPDTLCSKDGGNYGFLFPHPVDCGMFNAMKQLFNKLDPSYFGEIV